MPDKVALNIAHNAVASECSVLPTLSTKRLKFESPDWKLDFPVEVFPSAEPGDRVLITIVLTRAKHMIISDEPPPLPGSSLLLPPGLAN